MIRLAVLALAALTVASAAAEAPELAGATEALAGAYHFGIAEHAPSGCVVTLLPRAGGHTVLRARINTSCRRAVPSLRMLSQWQPTGGASVNLLGGHPLHTIGEFSPVQDGTGVYLRGHVDGDDKVYELRTPHQ